MCRRASVARPPPERVAWHDAGSSACAPTVATDASRLLQVLVGRYGDAEGAQDRLDKHFGVRAGLLPDFRETLINPAICAARSWWWRRRRNLDAT